MAEMEGRLIFNDLYHLPGEIEATSLVHAALGGELDKDLKPIKQLPIAIQTIEWAERVEISYMSSRDNRTAYLPPVVIEFTAELDMDERMAR